MNESIDQPIQTNLDEIYLEEIKTDTMIRNSPNRKSRIIHFSDGSLEVDENDNCINDKIDIKPKRLRLFQLIQSPLDNFMNGHLTLIGRKTMKKVDDLGENIASLIGITDSKFSSEINSSKQRKSTLKMKEEI